MKIKKIVGIVVSNVEPEVALNVIGHLAVSIGKYSNEEIMGKNWQISIMENGII